MSLKLHSPFSEELENLVLTLAREPFLVGNEQLNLAEVDIQNFRCESSNEMFSEFQVFRLQSSWHLRRVSVPSENVVNIDCHVMNPGICICTVTKDERNVPVEQPS